MSTSPDPRHARNLRRWAESGQPRQWVASHCGTWDHHDWLMLLANLRHSEFWPMHPDAVGAALEKIKRERANLRRWQDAEHGRRWVEARQGKWDHGDWLRLMDELRDSDFWPLNPEAVGRSLEGYRAEWRARHLWQLKENSRRLWRWQESGWPRSWVRLHQGWWDHEDWLSLLADLERSDYWPLDPEAVGQVLEGLKEEFAPTENVLLPFPGTTRTARAAA